MSRMFTLSAHDSLDPVPLLHLVWPRLPVTPPCPRGTYRGKHWARIPVRGVQRRGLESRCRMQHWLRHSRWLLQRSPLSWGQGQGYTLGHGQGWGHCLGTGTGCCPPCARAHTAGRWSWTRRTSSGCVQSGCSTCSDTPSGGSIGSRRAVGQEFRSSGVRHPTPTLTHWPAQNRPHTLCHGKQCWKKV